jgi:hypothetical protein
MSLGAEFQPVGGRSERTQLGKTVLAAGKFAAASIEGLFLPAALG